MVHEKLPVLLHGYTLLSRGVLVVKCGLCGGGQPLIDEVATLKGIQSNLQYYYRRLNQCIA